MHAYLLIGRESAEEIDKLNAEIKGKRYDFPVSKIEEVRMLNDFLKNSLPERTVIVCRAVDEATIEALNAFLKNLEEPQPNVTFILTARNEYKVLPTILSRCQLIHVKKQAAEDNVSAREFLNAKKGEQLLIIDKIKNREDAGSFVKSLIETLDSDLNKSGRNLPETAKNLLVCQQALNNLEANGNVNLQLSAMTVNLISGQK